MHAIRAFLFPLGFVLGSLAQVRSQQPWIGPDLVFGNSAWGCPGTNTHPDIDYADFGTPPGVQGSHNNVICLTVWEEAGRILGLLHDQFGTRLPPPTNRAQQPFEIAAGTEFGRPQVVWWGGTPTPVPHSGANFLVVWHGKDHVMADFDIFLASVSFNPTNYATSVSLPRNMSKGVFFSPADTQDDEFPSIGMTGSGANGTNGNPLIAWQRRSGPTHDIYGSIPTPQGGSNGAASQGFLISVSPGNDDLAPSVPKRVSAPSTNTIPVVWMRTLATQGDLFGRAVGNVSPGNGYLLGPEVNLTQTAAVSERTPVVAGSAQQAHMIVYEAGQQPTRSAGFLRFTTSTHVIAVTHPPTPIASPLSDRREPSITHNRFGSSMMVTFCATNASQGEVRLIEYRDGPTGATAFSWTSPNGIVMATGAGIGNPAIVAAPPQVSGNQALVVYEEERSANSPGIYARFFHQGTGGAIYLFHTQDLPGGPVTVHHRRLVPGREYYCIYDLHCPSGPGHGPPILLGLCGINPGLMICELPASAHEPWDGGPYGLGTPESPGGNPWQRRPTK